MALLLGACAKPSKERAVVEAPAAQPQRPTVQEPMPPNTPQAMLNPDDMQIPVLEQSLGQPVSRAIIFGGNCEVGWERPGKKNMFFPSVHSLTASLRARHWETQVLFSNPTDADADQLRQLQEISGQEVQAATVDRLLRALESSLALPKGSQLLIQISTHGSPMHKDGEKGEVSHGICASALSGGFKALDGLTVPLYRDAEMMPIDFAPFVLRLKALRDRGIKLALTDSSCYGGGSVTALSDYACVLSEQARNRSSRNRKVELLDFFLDSKHLAHPSMNDAFWEYLTHEEFQNVNVYAAMQPQISSFSRPLDISESFAYFLGDVPDLMGSGLEAMVINEYNKFYDNAYAPNKNFGKELSYYIDGLLKQNDDAAWLGAEMAKKMGTDRLPSYAFLLRKFMEEAKVVSELDILDQKRDLSLSQVISRQRAYKELYNEISDKSFSFSYTVSERMSDVSLNLLDGDVLKMFLEKYLFLEGGKFNANSAKGLVRVEDLPIAYFDDATDAAELMIFDEDAETRVGEALDALDKRGFRGSIDEFRFELQAEILAAREASLTKIRSPLKEKIRKLRDLSASLVGHRWTRMIDYPIISSEAKLLRAYEFLAWRKRMAVKVNSNDAAEAKRIESFKRCEEFTFTDPTKLTD